MTPRQGKRLDDLWPIVLRKDRRLSPRERDFLWSIHMCRRYQKRLTRKADKWLKDLWEQLCDE